MSEKTRKDSTYCHIQDDGFYKTVLHIDEPFCTTLQVAIVTEFCFMGSSFFLVILDTESKVSFHIVLKSPL